MPNCFQGFENINRYYDRANHIYAAKIKPGEFYVTNQEEVIVTVLGSCISVCLTDRKNRIGGMNHFMLPVNAKDNQSWREVNSLSARYGNFAMEFLINNIIRNGGERRYLEAKLFGGARVIARMSDVGEKNIAFIRQYTASEALKVIAEDMGGERPRKLVYNPLTGAVRLKMLKTLQNDTLVQRENNYLHDLEVEESATGEIELFD